MVQRQCWLDVTKADDRKRRLRWCRIEWLEMPAIRSPIPSPPAPPPIRLISHKGGCEVCPRCGSTMMRRKFLIFGSRPGCIQPDCINYGRPFDRRCSANSEAVVGATEEYWKRNFTCRDGNVLSLQDAILRHQRRIGMS